MILLSQTYERLSDNSTLTTQIVVSLSSRQGTKKFAPVMGARNISIDICRYLNGSIGSTLLDLILKDMKKYTNFFHSCPYTVRTRSQFNCVR